MGRKGNWFSSVKKALSPDSKEKKDQRSSKSKKKWFSKQNLDASSTPVENVAAEAPLPPLPLQPDEEVKVVATTIEANNHGYTLPVVAAEPPEPPAPVVQTAPEVVRKANKFTGKSREEAAAIRIQTAFRGYLARRALRALRGLVRLKMLMGGPTVKRQAVHTLKCMQTLARVQTQIHTRRVRMSEENQALQRQLLQKHAKELDSLRMKEGWDDSVQSKEQVESNLLSKYEAAMRRERALAYAFSHQQTLKNSTRPATGMFMTPGNPSWGWSWLERWMSAHPWETRNGATTTDKDPNNDQASVKSGNNRSLVGGEINKAYARYQLNSDKLSPGDHQISTNSPSATSKPISSVARKLKSASPRSSIGGPDEDTRSMVSFQSNRRHSIAGSSVRDDESLASLPSYMVPTQSAKAKSRLQSPLGLGGSEKNGATPPEKEKGASASAKKRLAYPPSSPARPRRHSGPPKVDSSLIKAGNGVVANGGDM